MNADRGANEVEEKTGNGNEYESQRLYSLTEPMSRTETCLHQDRTTPYSTKVIISAIYNMEKSITYLELENEAEQQSNYGTMLL